MYICFAVLTHISRFLTKSLALTGLFFMYTKLKNLYTIRHICIAKPHFLYKLPYLRKKKFTFFIKMFCALNI